MSPRDADVFGRLPSSRPSVEGESSSLTGSNDSIKARERPSLEVLSTTKEPPPRHDSSLNVISIWKRANRGDYSAFIRACLNLMGGSLFLAGSVAGLKYHVISCAALFVAGNLCYIMTGLWWAYATRHEFHARYGNTYKMSRCDNPSFFYFSRPVIVAGPGSVAPPYAALPAALEGSEIISAFHTLAWLDVSGALCQVLGGALFNAGCGTQWYPHLAVTSINFWLIGSSFFLLQAFIGHVLATSLIGTWLTLIPRTHHYRKWALNMRDDQFPYCCQSREAGINPSVGYRHLMNACWHKCVPAALLNTLGSAAFVLGSALLYWNLFDPSNWCYTIGSCMFVISNYSDVATVIDELYRRVASEEKLM